MMSESSHLMPFEPPEFLFKTVCNMNIDETFKKGLKGHAGAFVDTWETEGESRRGFSLYTSYTFVILSGLMHEDGYKFYRAETGAWLTKEIPAKYLRFQ